MKNFFISFETLAYCLVIIFTAPIGWEATKCPPGEFDPLGSGAVPLAVSVIILILCALGLFRRGLLMAGQRKRSFVEKQKHQQVSAPSDKVASDKTTVPKTPHLVVFIIATSVLYCLAFQLEIANFAVLTTIFLWAAIFMLSDFSRKHLFWSLVVALACSLMFFFVFTRIFVVDLPGAY